MGPPAVEWKVSTLLTCLRTVTSGGLLLNSVMKLWVPRKARYFLTNGGTKFFKNDCAL